MGYLKGNFALGYIGIAAGVHDFLGSPYDAIASFGVVDIFLVISSNCGTVEIQGISSLAGPPSQQEYNQQEATKEKSNVQHNDIKRKSRHTVTRTNLPKGLQHSRDAERNLNTELADDIISVET
eukprot:10014468-Ditylum_brightwellii.AAC.1